MPRGDGVAVVAVAHRKRAREVDAPRDVRGRAVLEAGAADLVHQVEPHEVSVVVGGEADADGVVAPNQEPVGGVEVGDSHHCGGYEGTHEVRPPGKGDPGSVAPRANRPKEAKEEGDGEKHRGHTAGCEDRSRLIVGLDKLIFPLGLERGKAQRILFWRNNLIAVCLSE